MCVYSVTKESESALQRKSGKGGYEFYALERLGSLGLLEASQNEVRSKGKRLLLVRTIVFNINMQHG